MKTCTTTLAVIGFVCLARGAIAADQTVDAYLGPRRMAGEVAIIVAQDHPFTTGKVSLRKIDGVPVDWPTSTVAVLPGPHTVQFAWTDGEAHSTYDLVLTIPAEAGRRYEVRATRASVNFVGMLIGAEVRGYAWVVDLATEEVVAGAKPPQP